MNRASQSTRILAHLASGNTLTSLEALRRFSTLRLAARVRDLKDAGHPIVASMVRKNGKLVAAYRMSI